MDIVALIAIFSYYQDKLAHTSGIGEHALRKQVPGWTVVAVCTKVAGQMAGKIVLLTYPSDQGDILKDYIEWHFHLGIDLILAQDCGSSDETHEILNAFEGGGALRWFRRGPEYQLIERLVEVARTEYSADWIILNDVDEFLRPEGDDLRTILDAAERDGITAFNVPCRNMTGAAYTTERAIESYTLRIDRPVQETEEQQLSGDIPIAYIFIRHPPKIIVRASALPRFGRGTHEVDTSWGATVEDPEMVQFLHFPIRGFDRFERKVKNVAAFFQMNAHLPGWWGWHWRRWIRIDEAGKLREEYENQFVSPERQEELLRQGICSIETTVADWVQTKRLRLGA